MRMIVDLARQTLSLSDAAGRLLREYPVSTALRGPGERRGSFRTPRGRHVVRARVGAGLPAGAVLKGRRWTGEIASAQLVADQPDRDWILSRILWLSGCQPGFNRFGDCDTMARYIYIHGTPDTEPMGVPKSHGCIRMRNADVIELFERIPVGTEVLILPDNSGDPATFPLVSIDWRHGRQDLTAVRQAVFVEEQGIAPAIEFDAADTSAMHFLVWDWHGRPVACARLLAEGRVGRMAVMPSARGSGLGVRLLEAVIEEARRRGWFELRLAAQLGAAGFYTRAGFAPVGDRFESAGIDHQMMRLFL